MRRIAREGWDLAKGAGERIVASRVILKTRPVRRRIDRAGRRCRQTDGDFEDSSLASKSLGLARIGAVRLARIGAMKPDPTPRLRPGRWRVRLRAIGLAAGVMQ